MQSRNQWIDDLSRLLTNGLGLAQNAKGEFENAIRSILDRYLADKGLVTREEFDMSQLVIQEVREEVSKLNDELKQLKKLSQNSSAQKRSKKLDPKDDD